MFASSAADPLGRHAGLGEPSVRSSRLRRRLLRRLLRCRHLCCLRRCGLLTLTFFGDVASAAKILTVPGIGLTLASSGFPVGQTIDNYGFDSLPNWKKFFISAGADKVYVWYNSVNGWATYFHNGTTGWQVIPPAGLSITVADPIPPDSAMFIDRIVVDTAAESGAEVDLPYIP